ncbi:MAG: DNA polymerase, partial [Clostridiales bacterium]
NMLNKVLVKENPDYLLVCFDKSRKTFRNNIFAEYKGTRKETPQELRGQFELIKEVLDASSISWLELADYEADDLLGTFSQKGQEDGFLVHIYTGDRDILQLISPQVKVYLTKKGISNLEEWDEEKVREHYALEPKQLIDLKALMGDASDNISGIPGVGEKTALKLMSQFSSIDELYANLEEIPKDKLKQKIAENEEVARMSYQLATICCQAPVQINWQELIYQPADNNKLLPIYQRLGFQSLLGTIKKQADQKEITKGKKSADEDAPWPTDDLNAIDNPDWAEQFPYQLLKKEQIDWFCGLAQKKGVLSLLLNWQDAYVDGNITDYALAISPEEAFLWADDRESFLVLLKQILADPGIKLITANAKEMGVLLAANGLAKVKFADDIVLAGYLLNPVLTHYEIEEIASANNIILKTYDEDGQLPYQAALCLSLAVILRENLADRDMLSLYEDVELPLSAVLGEMEASGITVDGQKLKEMSLELAKAADILAKEIQDLAGMEFNVNSPKQLADILFNKMQLPAAKKTKTGYSTNSDVLEQLAGDYPIAAKVLDYRTYAKLKSTYGDGLANLINPRTGKIHTSFKQTVTATGRLSSVEPNLQNIPVRLELGRQLRKVFLPSYSSLPSSSGNILLAG